MRCYYDALKICVVGKYWWCMNCDKYGEVGRSHKDGKINRRDIRKCIMCEIVDAPRQSMITNHHIIPIAVAQYHLQHKLGHSVHMCLDHHRMFHALIEPLIAILNSKKPPFRGKGDMTYWFINVKLPELLKRIQGMLIQ